jgi:hypothetical protein
MTDVDELVRRLTDVPVPTAAQLTPARERLLAGLPARSAGSGLAAVPTGRGVPGAPRRRRGRLMAAAAVTVSVAAGLTALSVVTTTTPHGTTPPPASATAAEILSRAAAAARSAPETAPRPDQFVYTESRSAVGVRRAWLSADGTHDGVVEQQGERLPIPGCRNGSPPIGRENGVDVPCEVRPAYQRDLPTTKAGMLAYLNEDTNSTNAVAKKGLSTADERYVRPAARAALYDALAAVPGIAAVQDARDGAGRRGIGVRWTYGGGAVTLVFDRTTYRFLGTDSDAVLRQAIVDRVGERS